MTTIPVHLKQFTSIKTSQLFLIDGDNDDIYPTHYFNQLYQVIQHIYNDGTDPTRPSLTNYIRFTLNHPDNLTHNPGILGIVPFEHRMIRYFETKWSEISSQFYQSGFFENAMNVPSSGTYILPSLHILLNFAIITNNPELVTWILNPKYSKTKTWDIRIQEAQDLIEQLGPELTDFNILADFFSLIENRNIGSVSRIVTFELLVKFSPRHYQVVRDNLESTWGGAKKNKSLILAIIFANGQEDTLCPLLRLLVNLGINLKYEEDIEPLFNKVIPALLSSAVSSIIKILALRNDVELFSFLFPLFGGNRVIFASDTLKLSFHHILRSHAYNMFDYLLQQADQDTTIQNTALFAHISAYWGNFINDENLCRNPQGGIQRGEIMASKLLLLENKSNGRKMFSEHFLDATLKDLDGSFQYSYRKCSGGLLTLFNHHSTVRERFKFDFNHFARASDGWDECFQRLLDFLISIKTHANEPDPIPVNHFSSESTKKIFLAEIEKFSLSQPFLFPRYDQRYHSHTSCTLFYDAFVPYHTFPPLAAEVSDGDYDDYYDDDEDAQYQDEDAQYQRDLEDQEAIGNISDSDDVSDLTSISMPILFSILSRYSVCQSRIVPLLTSLLKQTVDPISLNTCVNIDIHDFYSPPEDESTHQLIDNDTFGSLIKTKFQNLSPISFYIIVDIQRAGTEYLQWHAPNDELHPVELMIMHYIDALFDGNEEERHPQCVQNIIVKIPSSLD